MVNLSWKWEEWPELMLKSLLASQITREDIYTGLLMMVLMYASSRTCNELIMHITTSDLRTYCESFCKQGTEVVLNIWLLDRYRWQARGSKVSGRILMAEIWHRTGIWLHYINVIAQQWREYTCSEKEYKGSESLWKWLHKVYTSIQKLLSHKRVFPWVLFCNYKNLTGLRKICSSKFMEFISTSNYEMCTDTRHAPVKDFPVSTGSTQGNIRSCLWPGPGMRFN